MKLLTIGVPTYNRAAQLRRLLAAVVPACEADGRVEVLVSDNCSTDGTPAAAEDFRGYRCFRYLRSPQNRGFDGNILALLENAAGKFLWLLGDDDLIRADHLPKLLRLLEEQGEAALFFIDFMSDRAQPPKNREERALSIKKISAQQYADHYLYRATLISTNIINLAFYRQLSIDRECISHGWIHLHLLLLLADRLKQNGEKVVAVRDQIVIQGSEEGPYSLEKWVRTFIYNFAFTLDHTATDKIDRRRFLKGFYDINIRPTFLTASRLVNLAEPLADYRQIVKTFNMNLTGRLSFWLQYLLLWKGYALFRRFFRSARG